MKIAVVQHRLRGNARDDAAALARSAVHAAAQGAELVVLPELVSLGDVVGESTRAELVRALEAIDACCIFPHIGPVGADAVALVELCANTGAPADMGRMAVLRGDACLDSAELVSVAGKSPSIAVLMPRSENDLQAEATLGLAISLSDSLAGLVIVAECAGGEQGEAGHGGSAIILLGEVLAEALEDDEIVLADVPLPVPQPAPRDPLPVIVPLLLQRLELHQGRRVEVAEYPSDVT